MMTRQAAAPPRAVTHAEFTSEHPVQASAEAVFPLLCPVREREWLEGWSCDLQYSKSGLVERGCIFTTDRAPEGPMTWVTTVHDPASRTVEFVRVASGRLVVRMGLRVDPLGEARSVLRVEFAVTGLSADGDATVAEVSADGSPHRCISARLAAALDRFLAGGAPG